MRIERKMIMSLISASILDARVASKPHTSSRAKLTNLEEGIDNFSENNGKQKKI